ELQVGGK
ncbi:hypothetical protein VCHC44C1_1205B, partial [Vibrio cholerae HC-44C1]